MTDEVAPALAEALRDRYLLERELGRGGMATVYLAGDLKHDRVVALKVLRPELSAILGTERFLREIRLTAGLQHPHILPLLDSGEAGGLLYYVMPYVEGESLRQRLDREGQLPIDEAFRITRAVASALEYAHERGVVHRDIKPGNILLYQAEPMVADFGIALAATSAGQERLTETGLSLGTPAYMSPEQASATPKLDGRSDQYSLACVVYEMLAGEPPYSGPTAQAIIAKRMGEPVPRLRTLRSVPAGVESAVMRGLSRSPADRYPSVGQFAQALANTDRIEPQASVRARRRLIWWTTTLTLTLLLLIGAWWGVKTRSGAVALRTVALLPCENASEGPDDSHIGDRWSDELTQKLVRIRGLSPKSWASVRHYRNTQLPLRQIGTQLNAGALVRCEVAEQPTGIRLHAELIQAEDERIIWSNDYEQPAGAEGINAAQSAAARDIAKELGVTLLPVALSAVERPLTRDSSALRLYRVGKHFLQSYDEPIPIRKSIGDFEQAIARDSDFAQAYIGLAEAMIWRGERENLVSRDYYPAAAQLLRRSIALDPTIAEAHTFLARYLLDYTHDWSGAEEEHRQALILNPNSVDAHVWMAAANRESV